MKLAYRPDEAADALGVSTRTIWRLIQDRKIVASKLERSTVIKREHLDAYLASLPTFTPQTKEHQS